MRLSLLLVCTLLSHTLFTTPYTVFVLIKHHLGLFLHYFITVFSHVMHLNDDRIDTDTKVWDIMSAISLSQWSTTIGTPRLVG